jgi:hypothetical protein
MQLINNMVVGDISQYNGIYDNTEYKNHYICKCRYCFFGNIRVSDHFIHDQFENDRTYKAYASGEQNNVKIHISITYFSERRIGKTQVRLWQM